MFHFGNQCIQALNQPFHFDVGDDPATYSEDCLYLNIYVPTGNQSQGSLPVMVWIHGGAYFIGAGSQYDGTSLAEKGVIIVTINYRLTAFGFLSTGDEVMPGNYGMLDQIAALQWVKDNIGAFGGDANQVTIFGESAGSTSVSLLMLSPLAGGLFQRAIMESGSSLSSWAIEHPVTRVSAKMLSRLLGSAAGCSATLDNSTALMKCLQNVQADVLLNISTSLMTALNVGLPWLPRVEKTFGFLPDLPINLLSRGEFNHVDTISGFNGDEEGLVLPMFIYSNSSTRETSRTVMVLETNNFPGVYQEKVINLMEKTYLTNTTDDTLLQQQTIDSIDDLLFAEPTLSQLEKVVKAAPEKSHFLYRFSYRPSWQNVAKWPVPKWTQAFHADEIGFVFNVTQPQFTPAGYGPPDTIDVAMSLKMMEMWTNFAKSGAPTALWNPYSIGVANYLDINTISTVKQYSRAPGGFYKKIIQMLNFGMAPTQTDQLIG